ncbi:MAG: hypothetical protein OWU84_07520 [Firmicutes bacterium]|nr:hypothetical protein [Bacillota bacterium]
MSDWGSGTFNPGAFSDWIQSVLTQMSGNLRGLAGFPREEMVRQMDDFALRSMKRHLLARRDDIDDMLSVIEAELARRGVRADEPGEES